MPRATVERILALSQRAPSGTNTQPWYVHVCSGAVRAALVAETETLFEAGRAVNYSNGDYYPERWNDTHRERRRGIGWALYGLLGIEMGDREKSREQHLRNYHFFDAPVGMFFTTDTYLGRGSWSDAGLFMQTVMLAARGEGLHTCPQAAWMAFPEPVYRHLDIPQEQVLISGMAMGYADEDAVENTLISEREALTNVATFHGFD